MLQHPRNYLPGCSEVSSDHFVCHRNGIRSDGLRFFKKKDGKTLIHTHEHDLLHDPHHVRESSDGGFESVILHLKIARANVSESRATDAVAIARNFSIHIYVKGDTVQYARSG